MPKIKASIRNVGPADKARLKNACCLLLVSVGSEAHEGERFEATVALVNETFGSCVISLYDSLQRYTMALNASKSPESFHEQARAQGDHWQERNAKAIAQLTNLKEIVRWDRWIDSAKFLAQRNRLREEYERNPDYKQAFTETINGYLSRYLKHTEGESEIDLERAKIICFEYLLEECTALCLWAELGCEFEVYTSDRNPAMSATHRLFVMPHYSLLLPLRLGFKNAPQMKPQHQRFIFDDLYSEAKIKKMSLTEQVHMLESILAEAPGHIYWMNKEGYYLGCNDSQARSAGLMSRTEIVGKYNRDLPWNSGNEELAEQLDLVNSQVMKTEKAIVVEEPGAHPDGSRAVFLSIKKPLYDSKHKLAGLVGISIDITAQKEAERLQHENELHLKTIEVQEKLASIASQVAHDIGSPLASLKMLTNACDDLPESRRIALREVARSIENISQQLLSQYKSSKSKKMPTEEFKTIFLPALILQELIQDRMVRYPDIQFRLFIQNKFYFEGLFAQQTRFTRMISNLLNNAIDAMQDQADRPAILTLTLNKGYDGLSIQIHDTGKGMSAVSVEAIKNQISFTQGKENGHGIGLTQVSQTLKANNGRMEIQSTLNIGTQIELFFPYSDQPNWLGSEIKVLEDDIIVIVDDDPSIHFAWDHRFEKLISENSEISVQHFHRGADALDYLHQLSPEDHSRVYLLTDYEFINDDLTGFSLIRQSEVARSMVVTSHFNHARIQEESIRLHTKLLPKPLASEVKITMESSLDTVDVIMIEDYLPLVQNIQDAFGDELYIKYYSSPEVFLKSKPELRFNKEVKICIDKNFSRSSMNGLELARILHELGFKNLTLCSGDALTESELPDFLEWVDKMHITQIFKNLCAQK